MVCEYVCILLCVCVGRGVWSSFALLLILIIIIISKNGLCFLFQILWILAGSAGQTPVVRCRGAPVNAATKCCHGVLETFAVVRRKDKQWPGALEEQMTAY